MNALVIAPQPFFTPRGTPFSVYYRTLVMAELGARVDLLTYGDGEDVDIPGVRLIRIPRLPFLGPVAVGPSWKKALLDAFLVLWTIALLLRRRYEIVHAHEEAVFFCRFLKPVFRFKLIYDMHSSLPQQLLNFRYTRRRAIVRLFDLLEEAALRKADAVITICPELARHALQRMNDPTRHVLIENSLFEEVRLAGAEGAADGQRREPLELPKDRSVVAYAGTFEAYQGLDLLLRAFALVRQRCPEAFLLLVGGTPEQVQRYRAAAAELGIDRDCLVRGRVPPEVARTALKQASVLVSPRVEGTNTPLKVYEQLASGIPLVATRVLSHTQVLDETICFLVDPEPRAMAAGIVEALRNEPKRREIVAQALARYESCYSRPAYVAKVRRVLEMLR